MLKRRAPHEPLASRSFDSEKRSRNSGPPRRAPGTICSQQRERVESVAIEESSVESRQLTLPLRCRGLGRVARVVRAPPALATRTPPRPPRPRRLQHTRRPTEMTQRPSPNRITAKGSLLTSNHGTFWSRVTEVCPAQSAKCPRSGMQKLAGLRVHAIVVGRELPGVGRQRMRLGHARRLVCAAGRSRTATTASTSNHTSSSIKRAPTT